MPAFFYRITERRGEEEEEVPGLAPSAPYPKGCQEVASDGPSEVDVAGPRGRRTHLRDGCHGRLALRGQVVRSSAGCDGRPTLGKGSAWSEARLRARAGKDPLRSFPALALGSPRA